MAYKVGGVAPAGAAYRCRKLHFPNAIVVLRIIPVGKGAWAVAPLVVASDNGVTWALWLTHTNYTTRSWQGKSSSRCLKIRWGRDTQPKVELSSASIAIHMANGRIMNRDESSTSDPAPQSLGDNQPEVELSP